PADPANLNERKKHHGPGMPPSRVRRHQHAQHGRLRGMPGHGRHLDASSAVPHLRPCRLLRRFEEQARDQAFPLQPSPDRDLARPRRVLELVLCRRGGDGTRMSGEATSAQAPAAPSAWSPLSNPLFRNLWIATIVSNVGSWMQDVGAGWLMTELS